MYTETRDRHISSVYDFVPIFDFLFPFSTRVRIWVEIQFQWDVSISDPEGKITSQPVYRTRLLRTTNNRF